MATYNSDELRMLIALLSRLDSGCGVSERTLETVLDCLRAAVRDPDVRPGQLKEFRLVFRDGLILDNTEDR
jgi:hypothetical protein